MAKKIAKVCPECGKETELRSDPLLLEFVKNEMCPNNLCYMELVNEGIDMR